MATKTKFDTDRENREIVLKRTFDAPPKLVFECYSSCEHIKNWWGPRTWPTTFCEMDFREGGTWRYRFSGPNEGDEAWGKAVYEEIVEPEKIVYTDSFTDEKGTVNEAMATSHKTIEFNENNGQTNLVSTAKYATVEELDAVINMGVLEGMDETWDRLDEYLATL